MAECSRTPFLLGFNGCDHSPARENIGEVIEIANEVCDFTIKHTTLEQYIDKVRPYKDDFYVYEGEIAGQNGNGYGTPKQPVLDAMEKGLNMVLDIDPQGALQVMETMPGCVSVFILPPSYSELRRRLTERNTESPEEVERRLNNARGEIALMDRYQYLIVNDELEKAYEQLKDVVNAEKQRSVRYFPIIEE